MKKTPKAQNSSSPSTQWWPQDFRYESKTALPLSDGATYCNQKQNNRIQRAQDYCIMNNRIRKIEQVKRWLLIIKDLRAEIDAIKSDISISAEKKKIKIKRRNDILNNYMKYVADAQKYMGINPETLVQVR